MKRISIFWAAWIAFLPAPSSATPQPIEQPGTYVHESAGAAFPERIGEFERTNMYRYDEEGTNIGANYSLRRPNGRLHLTVYVYPSQPRPTAAARAEICSQEFEESRRIIVSQHKGAQRVDDGAAPAANEASGHRSVYRFVSRFDGTDQEVRSEIDLYCHVGGQWQVKYRATFPAGYDATQDIETFIRNGPWPGRAADPDKVVMITRPAPSGAVR